MELLKIGANSLIIDSKFKFEKKEFWLDELLEFVKNYSKDYYEKYLSSHPNWNVLYNLSKLRQNIIFSCDIGKNDKVLELGSECGVITETLCQKANSVTCVETSFTKSLVNAYRNNNNTNLKIFVTDYNNAKKYLQEKYNVIAIIGLKHNCLPIKNDDDFKHLLKALFDLLEAEGKIYIAFENRLGLKYFAGCREDISGLFNEGLYGYENSPRKYGYAKEEIEKILSYLGAQKINFFYPYPNYQFCNSLYSDEYLPKIGELSRNTFNLDMDRYVFFDERKVFDSLITTNYFKIFSNSFLVEIIK